PPVGGAENRVRLLWEGKIGIGRQPVGARRRTPAVELPEEQREGDVVRDPDDRPGLEQGACRIGRAATVNQGIDQEDGRDERIEYEQRDERDRDRAQEA